MSLFFLFLFYRRILLYVLFFCLPHKRPGAPAKRKRKDNRSATSVAKASAGFASSSFGTPENGGLRNSPAKAGSDSLLPFSVSGLLPAGKTEAGMNRIAAFSRPERLSPSGYFRRGRNTPLNAPSLKPRNRDRDCQRRAKASFLCNFLLARQKKVKSVPGQRSSE